MPLLQITTNISLTPSQKNELLQQSSTLISTILEKPELVTMVILHTNLDMHFATTSDPCAYVELKGLEFPEDQTSNLSNSICKFLFEQCQIQPKRTFVVFSNVERHMWGWGT